jgi:hypothetical protein
MTDEQTWFPIDFGNVEEICYAISLAREFAYKERLNEQLEERIRIDIEGATMWICARDGKGNGVEYRHDLAFSPFGNTAYAHFPKGLRPPDKVAWMIEPVTFCQYLTDFGSKAQIMLQKLMINWKNENVEAALIYTKVTGKRRPL